LLLFFSSSKTRLLSSLEHKLPAFVAKSGTFVQLTAAYTVKL
jgi:hypothetical protein